MESVKYPVNFEIKNYKDLRLYCKYLDCKAQTPEGVFRIYHSKDHYYRVFKELLKRGWATQLKPKTISLRAYQYVWRDLGTAQVRIKNRVGFAYKKIEVSRLSDKRKEYLKQIETIIRKHIAHRKAAQIRWTLNKKQIKSNEATFSAKSAAGLFGYKSHNTGSKIRSNLFSVIKVPGQYWNHKNKRYEYYCQKIAL